MSSETNANVEVERDAGSWRREGIVATILAAYSVLLLFALFLSWHGCIFRLMQVEGPRIALLQSALYVICAGGLGSTTYCIRAFYYYTIKEDFQFERYLWWYVFRPLSGIILAVAAFALTKGGVVVFGGNPTSTGASNYALFGMAYLAGFGSEEVVERLRVASKAVFGIQKSLGDRNQSVEGEDGGETGEGLDRL